MFRILNSIAMIGVYAGLTVQAADLRPSEQSIETVIDHYIDGLLKRENVQAAAQVDEHILVRRLMLDLAGRIPTTAELHAFLAAGPDTRRAELVDHLLASPDFASHHRNEIQLLLEYPDRRNDGDFRKYLQWAVEQNRPWNLMFRDMLAGDENDEYQKAALQFVKHRARNLDDLTNDTAVLFFGVNVSCAKCHDHPLVEDWKQDHYFGMQSFFSRTYLTKKNDLAEKFYGEVKFTTTAGVEKQARFMFLNGAVVADGTPEMTDESRKKFDEIVRTLQKDEKAAANLPEFRPRERLVETASQTENAEFLARNIVNRIWHRLTGRGIVHPPDQMHSGNAPSHPELLDWLARDIVAHGYDLKRLIRGIVLSSTYSRSSEWASAAEPPSGEYYAVAISRPMSPRQYAMSLLVATRNPPHWEQWLTKPVEDWKREREGLENSANGWAGQFEIPGENFQIAVDEALFFSNNDRIQNDLVRDSGDRLVGHLKQIENTGEAVIAAFEAISSRKPTDDELAAILDYLESRSEDRNAAMKQVVWALLTGSELRFNY
ncbi:MAG: DUF1553 domain-containing protein [Planctomycetota bacterium]|nr:DUF1553 domain-containing protein [Planctomycetota bacterium]